ncbi:MAG: hypothetical protein ABIS03_07345 [Gemmatimonadaceae bacterium]
MFIKQRVPQYAGTRGSLKWIQRLVELNPSVLTDAIRAGIGEAPDWTVDWVSPRQRDQWAEYRDAGFLLQLDLPGLIPDLKAFWPPGGPQWDALGKTSGKTSGKGVVLVEAKAHLDELTSNCGAGEKSRIRIDAALALTKTKLSAPDGADWTYRYYQYANRLAHLEFLRSKGVRSWLVFLYFYGDAEMGGPMSPEEWTEQLGAVYRYLGYKGGLLSRGVVNVFLPVEALTAPVV